MPWVGSEAMSLHLDALSKVVTPGAHAVLVSDGADWHQTGAVGRRSLCRAAGIRRPSNRAPNNQVTG